MESTGKACQWIELKGNVKIVSKEEAEAAALNHFILHQDIINNYAMS